VRYRGETLYVDSWSNGGDVVWLAPQRHARWTVECRPVDCGCVIRNAHARKFHIRGTRRKLGAIGAMESFETVIIALSPDDARELVRDNWNADWQDILCKSVREV
jgi:hypothetical protein